MYRPRLSRLPQQRILVEHIEAALMIAERQPPDVIVSDYRLREQRTGTEAISADQRCTAAAQAGLIHPVISRAGRDADD